MTKNNSRKRKMKTKCLICNKKNSKSSVSITDWIIKSGENAKMGRKKEIHSSCLTEKLYIERPTGFVYGRVSIFKPKKKKK
jgi:hypothetical protein|tara:strand:- start:123 stop:365 length:243 start_codon:yes stop_codon:yes gene_type:complete